MSLPKHEVFELIEKKFARKDLPKFHVGDTVKMMIKVKEGDKSRLHPFEGTVISKTGQGTKGTFTVRKISFGEGVERIFPMHSPVIENFKVITKGKVTTSKLYYLRDEDSKRGKIKKEQAGQEQPAVAVQAQ
jgi:large subunit ribosomal protein L19